MWLPIEIGVQVMYESREVRHFDSVHQKFEVGDGLGGIVHIHCHKGFLSARPAGPRLSGEVMTISGAGGVNT